MIRIAAVYYDGKVSRPCRVEMNFDGRRNLKVSSTDFVLEYPFNSLRFSPRIGNTQRDIFLPDGGKCETFANREIDDLLGMHRADYFARLVHALENHLVYILVSIVLTIGFVWGFSNYGIPLIAKEVALALPPEADIALGEQSLEVLDRLVFSETTIPAEKRSQLTSRFRDMRVDFKSSDEIHLLFRNSESLGANAIALPSGIIVATDALVELAEHEDELVAILAHELGHVRHRHGLRTVLQSSFLVLVISWLTGDISSLSALSAALPVKIIEAKYSRQFEWEADRFARDYLIANRIPLYRFSDILSRIEKQSPSAGKSITFLASHPATRDRVALFASAKSAAEDRGHHPASEAVPRGIWAAKVL